MQFVSILFVSTLIVSSSYAKDKVLVLSGGDNPSANHYSQYLQTKTLTSGLRARRGDEVTVRFGAGNNQSNPKLAADVHRLRSENGSSRHEMVFGVIDGNEAATKSEVNKYFSSVSGLEENDTFFLFVSDHGMPNPNEPGYGNNCINLWNYDSDSRQSGPRGNSCLSRSELGELLEKLPSKRKVFVMSQCFSGGFHQMSIEDKGGYPSANPNVCGFTAITEDTTASGCTPDVDGPGYKGYERFFTQQVTGTDVVSGKPMPYAAKYKLSEAHEAAALEDTTKDIPLRTSDYYLIQWAKKLGSRNFTPRTRTLAGTAARTRYLNALSAREAVADTSGLPAELQAFAKEKLAYLKATVTLLSGADPEAAPIYAESTQERINLAIGQTYAEMGQLNGKLGQLQQEAGEHASEVESQWMQAVQGNKVPGLTQDMREKFEPFVARASSSAALQLLSFLTTKQPQLGAAFGDYYSTRDKQMADWARRSGDRDLVSAQNKYEEVQKRAQVSIDRFLLLQKRYDNLRRVLLTRQELSALGTLGAMADTQALTDLKGLLACESASL